MWKFFGFYWNALKLSVELASVAYVFDQNELYPSVNEVPI